MVKNYGMVMVKKKFAFLDVFEEIKYYITYLRVTECLPFWSERFCYLSGWQPIVLRPISCPPIPDAV